MDLANDAVTSTQALGRLAAQATIAARKEIGIPTDEGAYVASLEESYGKQLEELGKFVQAIEKAMESETRTNATPDYQIGPVMFSIQAAELNAEIEEVKKGVAPEAVLDELDAKQKDD
jgi:hypothetical protein